MDLDRVLNKTHLAQQIHTHTILKPKAEWLTMAYIKIHTSGTVAQPMAPASRRLRPEDPVLEGSLGHTASLRPAWVTQ